MFKTLACFALLSIAALNVNSFASPTGQTALSAVVAGGQIYGKGIHNKCLPYALGLAQILHDQYRVGSAGIVYTWVVNGFPKTVGRHIVVTYTTIESGVTKRWIADNETKYPVLVKGNNPAEWISAFNHNGTFTIDRILPLPMTNMSDKEYIGGALMAGTFLH
jgi:hypothetical protein